MNKKLRKRKLLLMISSFVLVILAGGVAAYYYYVYLPYSLEYAASPIDCKTISTPKEGGINLVFFATKDIAKKYSDYLFSKAPFDKEEDKFNVYYIDNFVPKCDIYKGIAILCYSKELLRKAAACPNDYIAVLKEDSPDIRSSSYENVMSLNLEHPESVLLHEFGHSFPNFAEEYAPASIPRGSENCQGSCTDFSSETDGCFKECSDGNHYRSIESGVMRTLSSYDYGKYDIGLILKAIAQQYKAPSPSITGNQILDEQEDCSKQFYYEAVVNSKGEVIGKTKQQGCPGEQVSKVGGKVIFTDAPGFATPENPTPNIIGETFESDIATVVQIPAAQVDSASKTVEIGVTSRETGTISEGTTTTVSVDFSGVAEPTITRKTGLAQVADKINLAIDNVASQLSPQKINTGQLSDESVSIVMSSAINETNVTEINDTNVSGGIPFNQRTVTSNKASSPGLTVSVVRELDSSNGRFAMIALVVLAAIVVVWFYIKKKVN